MIFRTIIHLLRSRTRSPLGIHDVGTVRLRVLPTDLDILGHMNNGVYFSIMDLGRMDLMVRAGLWKGFRDKGWYPVMANETATFRKSLTPWLSPETNINFSGYPDPADYRRSWSAETFARLAAVRASVDPEGVFAYGLH